MEPTPYTLSENTGAQPVKLLNKNLVGVMDLYALATQPHWNVRRRGLIAIHELENYRDLIVGRVDPLSGVVAQLHRSLVLEPLRHSANPYERPSA